MIFTYSEFADKLENIVSTDQQFYNNLLITVLQNPERYTGIFRLTNSKTKLIQNVTQSREIKLGDFLEEIVTEYIDKMGYVNLNKNIGASPSGSLLSADQVFKNETTVFLIEQKIRDDHDSTKKRGQFDNFEMKLRLLKDNYPNHSINANMWFIDSSLIKSRNYYISRARTIHLDNVEVNIFYGEAIFVELFNRIDIWNELVEYLLRHKEERNQDVLSIPDFDTSDEIFVALQNLKRLSKMSAKDIRAEGYKGTVKPLYNRLFSDDPKFVQLRKELFATGYNLNRFKKYKLA